MAGNIGTVASEVGANATGDEWIVTELSSFQLMGTVEFRPKISLILNIFDAHLDYHHTREEYEKAKQKVFAHQHEDDIAVINLDDPSVVKLAEGSKAKKVFFSVKEPVEHGAFIQHGAIYYMNEHIIDVKDVVLPGEHNQENILAAICVVKNAKFAQMKQSFTFSRHLVE